MLLILAIIIIVFSVVGLPTVYVLYRRKKLDPNNLVLLALVLIFLTYIVHEALFLKHQQEANPQYVQLLLVNYFAETIHNFLTRLGGSY